MLSTIDRWLSRVENLSAATAIFGLLFIIAAVCLEIVLRTFFNLPLMWVIEFSEYALLYITFLGTSWLLRRDEHVSVDLVTLAVSAAWRRRLGLTSALLGLVVALVLTIFGITITLEHMHKGTFKPTILEFPTWIVLSVIPFGSSLLSLRFLLRGIALWRNADTRSRGAA